MLKFSKILSEVQKNQWFQPSNLDEFREQIFQLISNAYSNIGGNIKFRSVSDVNNSSGQYFKVIDVDNDDEIDSVLVYKSRPSGNKGVAMGHDGSRLAVHTALYKTTTDLKKEFYYIEASGKLAEILNSRGVPVITDEKVVKKVLSKDIEWLGDGFYNREIAGKKIKKSLFGVPRK
jgi:hypothetical protein